MRSRRVAAANGDGRAVRGIDRAAPRELLLEQRWPRCVRRQPGGGNPAADGRLKPYATAGGYDIQIVFHPLFQLRRFTVDLVYGPGSPSAIATTAPRTFAQPQVQDDEAGVYVYAVSGTWPKGDVTFFLTLKVSPETA